MLLSNGSLPLLKQLQQRYSCEMLTAPSKQARQLCLMLPVLLLLLLLLLPQPAAAETVSRGCSSIAFVKSCG
jgi:hypothetical protein